MTRAASALITIMFLGPVLTAQPLGFFDSRTDIRAGMLGSYPTIVHVTVTDDAGRLIEGANVTVVGWSGVYNVTDSTGSVLIDDLLGSDVPPGTSYNFSASMDGYDPAFLQQDLLANQTYYITLVLRGATVYGAVTSKGHALIGANVSAVSKSLPIAYNMSTGPDGSYQLAGIREGIYNMYVTMYGYADGVANDLTLTAGAMHLQNFVLEALTGNISGYVRSSSGQPLAGVDVSVMVGGTTKSIKTNETGFYNHTELPEGTYSVTASVNGFYTGTITGVSVVRGEETKNVNLTLAPIPNRLYGVVKAGTLLLPGVNISIIGTAYYNTSNYEGSYQINNITAGIYNVSASLSGYETNITQVTIPAGSEILLLINLKQLPGSQLWVKVTASDTGAALVGVLVTITIKGGEPQTQSTNIDGRFAFTGLTPGNYTVQLVKAGYKPIELKEISISAEENETLTIRMEPLREGDTGFIFGFDMAHSMMILALFLTIVILAMAVWLRIKTFQAPESAPAVYDEEPEEAEQKKEEPAPAMNGSGEKKET